MTCSSILCVTLKIFYPWLSFREQSIEPELGLVWFGWLLTTLWKLGTKLSEECCKYGSESVDDDAMLAKSAAIYGDALKHVGKEQEEFIKLLSLQVFAYRFCCYYQIVR